MPHPCVSLWEDTVALVPWWPGPARLLAADCCRWVGRAVWHPVFHVSGKRRVKHNCFTDTTVSLKMFEAQGSWSPAMASSCPSGEGGPFPWPLASELDVWHGTAQLGRAGGALLLLASLAVPRPCDVLVKPCRGTCQAVTCGLQARRLQRPHGCPTHVASAISP